MWERAEGMPWKHLCHRFGISRPTAHRRYDYALSVIAWRLSGRQVHHRRGRRESRSSRHGRPPGARQLRDVMDRDSVGTWYTFALTMTPQSAVMSRFDHDHELGWRAPVDPIAYVTD